MFKKVITVAVCGVAALSLCACASGSALFDQVQNSMAENGVDMNDVFGDLAPAIEEIANSGNLSFGDDNEKESASSAQENASASLDNDNVYEETTVAVENNDPTTQNVMAADENDSADNILSVADDGSDDIPDAGADGDEEVSTGALIEANEETDTVTAVTKPEKENAKPDDEKETDAKEEETSDDKDATTQDDEYADAIEIILDSDTAVFGEDGEEIGTNGRIADVYISDDITYYEDLDEYTSGNKYGAGTEDDKHTAREAKDSKVLNITAPGEYKLSGKWEGQVKVDLGEDADTDKDAKVSLILDGVDITCTVAPAILFENVYECDADWTDRKGDSEDIKEKTTSDINDNKDNSEDVTTSKEDVKEEETTKSIFDIFKDNDETADEEETTSAAARDDDKNVAEDEDDKDSRADGDKTDDVTFEAIDTTDAGAVIVIAKDSTNNIFGSHVAEIYEDDDATEPVRLIKQDGAIYSYMSLNIEGIASLNDDAAVEETDKDITQKDEEETTTSIRDKDKNKGRDSEEETTEEETTSSKDDTSDEEKASDDKAFGVLNVVADNEGIDSEVHLTINGGEINIYSEDDGINTNESNVSIMTVNDGKLNIIAGLGGEGDGIDSNGWIVINGGDVFTSADPKADSGLDSDFGTYINGGTVVAMGSDMDSPDENSNAVVIKMQLSKEKNANDVILITDKNEKTVFEYAPSSDDAKTLSSYDRKYSSVIISSPEFNKNDSYYVYVDGKQQAYTGIGTSGRPDEPFGPGGIFGDRPGQPSERPDADQNGNFGVIPDNTGADQDIFGIDREEEDILDEAYGYGYQDAYDDIKDEYFNDWYDSWFEDSFADLFEEHGIDMDDVKDYVDKNDITFGPEDVADISGDQTAGRKEEITTDNNKKDDSDKTTGKGTDTEDSGIEFVMNDNINSFTGVHDADASEISGNDAKNETTGAADVSDKEDVTTGDADKTGNGDDPDIAEDDVSREDVTNDRNERETTEDADAFDIFSFFENGDNDIVIEFEGFKGPLPGRNRIFKHTY